MSSWRAREGNSSRYLNSNNIYIQYLYRYGILKVINIPCGKKRKKKKMKKHKLKKRRKKMRHRKRK
jgi:hypothetical protein